LIESSSVETVLFDKIVEVGEVRLHIFHSLSMGYGHSTEMHYFDVFVELEMEEPLEEVSIDFLGSVA
jgi:hypothetical protein